MIAVMMTLGERLEAAIQASGKSRRVIAEEAGMAPETISRIISGENSNPTYQLLIKIARATNTTVGALNGDSIQLSSQDDRALTQFRDWIDSKLATIDALTEPNAVILDTQELTLRESRVADRRRRDLRPPNPFGDQATLHLRALGESMRGVGILPNDTLYAIPRRRDNPTTSLRRIIACRIGDHVYVKRLTSVRRRHFLLSANPRYLPIEMDPEDPAFVILGIVVGRMGGVE